MTTINKVTRPSGPVRAALTLNARNALTSAEYDIATMRRYLGITWCVTAAAELVGLKLVDDHGDKLNFSRRYSINAAGDRMREYLLRENALRALARAARDLAITGEDLADVAAAVDADQHDCVGVSTVFYLTFKSRAEIDGTSGQDLLQDLARVLGW